jgi:hypothetical protein
VEPKPADQPAADEASIAVPEPRRESYDVSAPLESSSDVPQLAPLVPSTPPAAVVRRTQAGSSWPLRFAIIVGVVSLLCIGGLGIGYDYYNKATAPDRSTPAIAVQNYLQAFLNDRSDTDAAPYACADQSGLMALRSFRDSALKLAASLGNTASFGWNIGDVVDDGGQATVNVAITEQTSAGSVETGSARINWQLATRQIAGWRVCGATQTS